MEIFFDGLGNERFAVFGGKHNVEQDVGEGAACIYWLVI
tara:strand:- start:16 stop:132 length:117 start_codon:yes stop_codon:yes gene_type:complete